MVEGGIGMDLDHYQEAARLNMDSKVLLVAPPGSGKTTVLLAKIDYLLDAEGIDPLKILVLTFSRGASLNLKARFKGREVTPFFGTIHSFAHRELRKQKKRIQLIDREGALDSLQAIRRRFRLTPDEVAGLLSEISRERSTGITNDERPFQFRREVTGAYVGYKEREGLMDFDDLEEQLLSLLQEDAFRREVQSRFQWVLVDEFQDLNPRQLDILKLISHKAHLFCVGDEDQCIYAFRGSDTKAMIRFPEEFREGRILYLKYNYRSSATVIRHANQLIGHNLERYPKEIVNYRRDESPVEFSWYQDERMSLKAVSEGLAELTQGESAALIFRTNRELEEAALRLCRQGLSFTIQDRVYDRYGSKLYSLFINYLRYAQAGGEAAVNKELFLSITATGIYRLPADIRQQLSSPVLTEGDLLKGSGFDLTWQQREQLAGFFRDILRLRGMKPGPAIRYILYVMGLFHDLKQRADVTGESLTELLAEIEELVQEACDFPGTAEFLCYIDHWKDIMDGRNSDSTILLSTMHGVKGMEFDRVYVMNACEGLIPHERSLQEMEAERRLFYVALTRARHKLYVHSMVSWQGRPVTVSRFVKESGGELPDCPLEKEQEEARSLSGRVVRFVSRTVKGLIKSGKR